jgi:hypothetical protein
MTGTVRAVIGRCLRRCLNEADNADASWQGKEAFRQAFADPRFFQMLGRAASAEPATPTIAVDGVAVNGSPAQASA